MRSKIVTVEDVTKIVGISNYVQALNLKKENLTYDFYEQLGTKVKVHFFYEKLPITILINKEYQMMNMDCGCKPGLNYCPHIALAVMYLIEHEEDVHQMIAELNSEYDLMFNQQLFQICEKEKKQKKRLVLDINLKLIDYRNPDVYELQVKIGENKKYALKKQLEEFLRAYYDQEGEVLFGQNFCYRYEDYILDEIDQKIIDFIAFYVDSQNHTYRTFYGYHSIPNKLDNIRLTKESLFQFMRLIQQRAFTVEIGYYTYHFKGIEDVFPFAMSLKSVGKSIHWEINIEEVRPLVSNYEYVMIEEKMYHVREHRILELLLKNKKKEIILKQEEIPVFMNLILPKIEKNLTFDSILEQKIILTLPTVKYYFEKNKDTIIGKICLSHKECEKNIFEEGNNWNGVYLKRDDTLEEQYQFELFQRGFILEETQFILKEANKIVAFLEEGLPTLSKQYDVYVSQELKEMKVLKHVEVQSSFSLGRNNILSYHFQVEHVSQEELNDFLNALQLKKKYYRLKNGSYIYLEQKNVQDFQNMVAFLEVEQGNGNLPLYKSLFLEKYQKNDSILFNTSLQKFLEQFHMYKSIKIDLKSDNESILRDYQKIGIQWMLTLSKCGFSGILADEMGLGKSLQTIEYIKYKKKETKGTILLVVPTSLLYNWEHELQQFGKNLSYLIVNDIKTRRLQALKQLNAYDVVLTTYGLLRQDIEAYSAYNFDTFIIDEAQNIKNVNTETTKVIKQIHAKTRFALTGTPIENSVLELWSIFDFLMPTFLSTYAKFKAKYSIKAMEENPNLIKQLNEQISPFILRRKKKDVLKELPDKIEKNIYIDMTEEQKKLYLAELEQAKSKIQDTIQKDGFTKSQILILSLLTRLRQICIDPRLYVNSDIRSGKRDALLQVLREAIQNGHKILLFSQFSSALKLVQKELHENNITTYYLDGSTPSKTRIELVNSFNQDDTNVFLISLKAGGTGLNLTSADVVIHLDLWWNPQVENQATDRSHRIGQKHVVEVIRLIAKGTIEENILKLQSKKRKLSEQVIEGKSRDQIILSKLTEEELLSLFDIPN